MPVLQVGFAIFSFRRFVETHVHGILKFAFGLQALVLSPERVLLGIISIITFKKRISEIIFLWDTSHKTLRDTRISIFLNVLSCNLGRNANDEISSIQYPWKGTFFTRITLRFICELRTITKNQKVTLCRNLNNMESDYIKVHI